MKIAINFGDNDFGSTFSGVLESLKGAYLYNDRLPMDKELLCKIINEISYGCYLLYQNEFKHGDEKKGIIPSNTKEYLIIKPNKILLNDEVDEYLKLDPHGDSSMFILDTDLIYDNNNPIYNH